MSYYRITAYHKDADQCCIIDSNGMYEKLWQFSSYLVGRGFEILEVGDDTKFLDVNIERSERIPDKMILRAYMPGRPRYTPIEIDGRTYKAVMVEEKVYVPDRYAQS